MFVLSSPSGAGKTTLSRLLLEKDDNIVMSVSATTRTKREGETDGVDYSFVTSEKFTNMLSCGEFLESATVFGNSYGTPEHEVDKHLEAGVDVLFDIDWQGTKQIAASRSDDIVSVFILPPSMQELESRLKNRAQDDCDVIKKRMEKAGGEISHWHLYDYVIVNRDIDDSLDKILAILKAERQKRIRQHELTDFVKNLLDGQ